MGRWAGFLAVGVCALLCTGCAAFSMERFGPEVIRGDTLNDIIEMNGAPDMMASNGDLMVLRYDRVECLEVLGLFGSARRTTTGIVLDKTGKVIKKGTVPQGEALTIMGAWTTPLNAGKAR